MKARLSRWYEATVLTHPLLTLGLVLVLAVLAGLRLDHFRLDASADSLVLEKDRSLDFYRQIRAKFESSDDFLVITFTPHESLFSPSSIEALRSLRDDIEQVEWVGSTNSILNVPLLHSPDLSLDNLESHIKTLDRDDVELSEAREALLSNPLYINLLISEDAGTTAIQVNLPTDPQFYTLLKERDQLRDRAREGVLSDAEQLEYEQVANQFEAVSVKLAMQQEQVVEDIRAIMARYRDVARLHLGGVPMIVSDMIDYVESDLATFGLGVLIFILLTLLLIFRKWQWVILPSVCCLTTVWLISGYLGWMNWPITVISSNFISLLLIMTLSITIHIIVRFREFQQTLPDADTKALMLNTVQAMAKPCLYMALTTIVAFGSLTISGIRPVIDFGWMMTLGIGVAFVVAFLVLPALIVVLPRAKAVPLAESGKPLTAYVARFTELHGRKVMVFSLVLAVLCVIGVTRLTVENRFIDYFKSSTEIYQGMVVIDNKIGGTTPLDVIIDDVRTASDVPVDPFLDDCFEEDCAGEEVDRNTWYTYQKMEQLEQTHDYLESLPETGKVLSIATLLKLTQQVNQGKKLDALQLAFLPTVFPEALRGILLDPYLSDEAAQARFNIRLIESSPNLNRDTLMKEIKTHLVEKIGYQPEQIHFTGMAVLYNNMLQSLFDSQIKTLGAVFLAITIMFLVLFRSLSLAVIGMAPNLLAAGTVLGLMGWLEIPLDMMTITVASITVGIAVDNTIHYIHRFRTEFEKDQNYLATMHRCHASIGRAMFYTSLTIIIGFSILILSNFIPTIYFGLFTGMAMLVALLGALTLLPQMLVWFKPLGNR
ncbi:MAG: MMPL family transporter [Pseudomonadales bacterium]|nr:MMPL family transporter [Pseudomonadales bacterium]